VKCAVTVLPVAVASVIDIVGAVVSTANV